MADYKSKGKERATYIELFIEQLNKINSGDTITSAIELEKSCFNKVIKSCTNSDELIPRRWSNIRFVEMYATRCAIILGNISPESYMMKKIKTGEWKYNQVGLLDADELDPESSIEMKKILETRSMQKVKEKETNMYKCPKCGKKRTTVPQGKQLRSADESQTQFVNCLECEERFKIGH